MHICVLAIGRLKDRAIQSLSDDYLKRIRRHYKIEIQQIRSDAEALRRVPAGAFLVALDVGGRMRSSEELSTWLEGRLADPAPLHFVIGGAEGLSAPLRSRANEALSFGPMTLPHRLARVVLLEQLYRAVSIVHGAPYHK